MKQFVHIKNFDTFSSKHLSADINNTTYTVGMNSTVYNGTPDISYTSIVFIQDTKQVWTHGTLYNCYSEVGKTIDVTYLVLKALIAESKLIPGQKYRITDYTTSVDYENIHTANHPFDIIVIALTNDTLSEEAQAVNSTRDHNGYFSTSNLEAWKIWYCFDNDTNRFTWADTKGKGVIYRMIDEWNNDCPYDFKNILFDRYVDTTGRIVEDETQSTMLSLYTFSYISNTNTVHDITIMGNDGTLVNIDGEAEGVHDNIIKSYIYDRYGNGRTAQCINNIVFCSHYDYEEDGDYFYGCYNNTLGNDCFDINFGSTCYNNTLGINCFNNTFGDKCCNNTFGNNCYNNTFEDNCYYNTFGSRCDSNELGIGASGNIFDDYCKQNILGNESNYNKLGTYCKNNTIGTNSSHIILYNNCTNNSIGGSCSDICFLSGCELNNIPNRSKIIKFNNACSELTIIANTSDISKYVQNINVLSGYYGKTVLIDTFNQHYETKISRKPNGEIRMYCETDLWVNL